VPGGDHGSTALVRRITSTATPTRNSSKRVEAVVGLGEPNREPVPGHGGGRTQIGESPSLWVGPDSSSGILTLQMAEGALLPKSFAAILERIDRLQRILKGRIEGPGR